jgi:molybdenum cofactor synthesis domain-containing protein
MNRVEIVVVGREVLVGGTLDTNSHWIARWVRSLGGITSRIVAVDDNTPAIVREMRTARSNAARVIITVGGLGPTADDRTLAAVAEATGHPLVLDSNALDFVRERYCSFRRQGFVDSGAMTRSRQKMARIPAGSRILRNPVGAASGIHLDWEGVSVFSLPGVPREMEAIFEETIVEILKGFFGRKAFLEKTIPTPFGDESELGEILNRVMKENPGVYLKSRPTHFGRDVRIEVTLSASGDDTGEVKASIDKAIQSIHREADREKPTQ